MSKRLDSTILQEMHYAADRIVRRTHHSTLADFLQDEDLQDIVLRQLTIIGETTARISDNTKQRYPQIDWRRITGMRNFVVHEYFRVDFAAIWDVVINHLPPLLLDLPLVLAQVLADEQLRQTPSV
ncbi:MAG: HepT-like ribonuclease domain-containing protein [Janthinobacterium lividum]